MSEKEINIESFIVSNYIFHPLTSLFQVVRISDKNVLETKAMDLFKALASKAISDNDYIIAVKTLSEQYTEHEHD